MFEFNKLSNYTRIYLDGKLIFKDRLYMDPKEMDLTTMGQCADIPTKQLFLSKNSTIEEDHLLELLEKALQNEQGVEYEL